MGTMVFINSSRSGLPPPRRNNAHPVEQPQCPDVSRGIMKGRWIQRPLTSLETREITKFLQTVRGHAGLPESMQRSDGKCGTLPYERKNMFRALCDPKGATPCCYSGKCVSKTTTECRCPECYDLRTRIHAEYATWKPEDTTCKLKNFTAREACDLLKGETLVVVGDSLIRHVYTAMLLVLSNNFHDGALLKETPRDIHDNCTGMYTFTEKNCRKYVRMKAVLCDGNVNIQFVGLSSSGASQHFHANFKSLMKSKRNTTVLVGIGTHDNFNYTKVFREFINPVIEIREKSGRIVPRIIWAATHKFALLKSPYYSGQLDGRSFNRNMAKLLGKYNIPIFDTYSLTSGVSSPDGCHYGRTINVMKVHLFLNFYIELLKKEKVIDWKRVHKKS